VVLHVGYEAISEFEDFACESQRIGIVLIACQLLPSGFLQPVSRLNQVTLEEFFIPGTDIHHKIEWQSTPQRN